MSSSICMLAKPFNIHKVIFPCYVDIKLDGIRGFIKYENTLNIYSRNNKIYRNFINIEKELKILYNFYVKDYKTVNIDGEILNGHFQNLMRMAHRKIDGVEMAEDSTYTIFDIYLNHQLNITLGHRLEFLNDIKTIINKKNLKHLNVNIGKIAYCNNDILKYYNEIVALGFEGIMIKNLNSIYECKRSYNWMKMKPTLTKDLEIVSIKEGKNKYECMLGAFICRLPNGNTVNVGSGYTDEERNIFHDETLIGKIIEVKYQEKTKDGNLRFPTFLRFREDNIFEIC